MASDGKDLFEAAISLLTRKARKTKGRMMEEDVVSEIELIKFQLDALAKSHLLTSITLFKEGLLSLFNFLIKDSLKSEVKKKHRNEGNKNKAKKTKLKTKNFC